MKNTRNTTRWTLKTGSVLVLSALAVAPLLVSAQPVQADANTDWSTTSEGDRIARANDRGRDRNDRRDDNRRDNDRHDNDRHDNDRHDNDNRDNGRWRNNGNWRNNNNNRNDRERVERERREREERERRERERRERERAERERRERAERERRERWEREHRNDRDRWPGRNNGGWSNNGNWNNGNNGNWGNWGGGRTGSYSFTGTVEDSRNQRDTLWVRGDNGQTYSIRTRQAYRYRVGERVRVSGSYNSDNPSITSLGFGGRR